MTPGSESCLPERAERDSLGNVGVSNFPCRAWTRDAWKMRGSGSAHVRVSTQYYVIEIVVGSDTCNLVTRSHTIYCYSTTHTTKYSNMLKYRTEGWAGDTGGKWGDASTRAGCVSNIYNGTGHMRDMIVEKHIRVLYGPQWATGAASVPT